LGANIVLSGRNRDRLEQTAAAIETNTYLAPCDLTECEDIPKWMKSISAECGPFHGLVHSAGVQVTKPLQLLKPADVSRVLEVNVAAAVQLCRGFRQRGVAETPAGVVLISSVMGLAGAPAVAAYSASKGAICALVRSLAIELAQQQIRVNSVAPGHVHTEMADAVEASMTEEQFAAIESMHPLGIGEPVDVANAIAFLLAETGRWITGTTLVVDGGYLAH
jgi:NAD(P)-dependent dehydrogenase (short-subunit alcohol dehydrogenase family)